MPYRFFIRSAAIAAAAVLLLAGTAAQRPDPMPDTARLEAMAARFAPVDIAADVSRLPDSERQALVKIVDAARQMDAIFLRQVWPGNDAMNI